MSAREQQCSREMYAFDEGCREGGGDLRDCHDMSRDYYNTCISIQSGISAGDSDSFFGDYDFSGDGSGDNYDPSSSSTSRSVRKSVPTPIHEINDSKLWNPKQGDWTQCRHKPPARGAWDGRFKFELARCKECSPFSKGPAAEYKVSRLWISHVGWPHPWNPRVELVRMNQYGYWNQKKTLFGVPRGSYMEVFAPWWWEGTCRLQRVTQTSSWAHFQQLSDPLTEFLRQCGRYPCDGKCSYTGQTPSVLLEASKTPVCCRLEILLHFSWNCVHESKRCFDECKGFCAQLRKHMTRLEKAHVLFGSSFSIEPIRFANDFFTKVNYAYAIKWKSIYWLPDQTSAYWIGNDHNLWGWGPQMQAFGVFPDGTVSRLGCAWSLWEAQELAKKFEASPTDDPEWVQTLVKTRACLNR